MIVHNENMINYVQMIFVIQGKEIAEKVDLKAEIKLAVIRVLETVHLPPEFGKWKLKRKDGKEISMTKSYIEQGIVSSGKLFLSMGPGRGGQ